MPPGNEGKKARLRLMQKRVVRVVEHGLHRSVLLTLADLSVMLGISTVQASQFLTKGAPRNRTESLLTMGYYFDQGMRPTHKGDIVQLYEQGLDEAEIARHHEPCPEPVSDAICAIMSVSSCLCSATYRPSHYRRGDRVAARCRKGLSEIDRSSIILDLPG